MKKINNILHQNLLVNTGKFLINTAHLNFFFFYPSLNPWPYVDFQNKPRRSTWLDVFSYFDKNFRRVTFKIFALLGNNLKLRNVRYNFY